MEIAAQSEQAVIPTLTTTPPPANDRWDTLNKLVDVLKDGQWHTNWELVEKVGHRFGAVILVLRRGQGPDNECWRIQGEAVRGGKPGEWRYRHVGFAGGYRTKAPYCPKCGTKMKVTDVRSGDTAGEYVGAATTEKQTTLLEQKTAQVEKLEETIAWQANIIKRLKYDLAKAKGEPLPTEETSP